MKFVFTDNTFIDKIIVKDCKAMAPKVPRGIFRCFLFLHLLEREEFQC